MAQGAAGGPPQVSSGVINNIMNQSGGKGGTMPAADPNHALIGDNPEGGFGSEGGLDSLAKAQKNPFLAELKSLFEGGGDLFEKMDKYTGSLGQGAFQDNTRTTMSMDVDGTTGSLGAFAAASGHLGLPGGPARG